jgi:predicted dehydrogenase
MSAPVRVGVLGSGAVAQVAHLVTLSRLEGAEVVGICDIDVPKAQALAGRFGIPNVYDDVEDLLRYGEPDAVVVCTPNHLHEVHVTTVLSAGAHVLCERPLALSVSGVKRLIAAREQAGKAVLVGLNHRYRADTEAVRRFIAGGEFGALRAVRASWHIFRPVGPDVGWRARRRESGGGAMTDLGLPLVDLGLWLSGCPGTKRVTAVFSSHEGDTDIEDSACTLIRCDRGHSIFVDVSWRYIGQDERFSFEVLGDGGTASLAPLAVFKEMHGTPMNVTPPQDAAQRDAFSASYRSEWERFLAVVRGEQSAPELDDQVLLHRVMEGIYRSAADGCEVAL